METTWPIDHLANTFANTVKALVKLGEQSKSGYVSKDKAEHILQALPEFWREPARVMACTGYYASADEWMATHTE